MTIGFGCVRPLQRWIKNNNFNGWYNIYYFVRVDDDAGRLAWLAACLWSTFRNKFNSFLFFNMEIFVLLLIGTWRKSTFNYVDKIKIHFILRARNPASTIFFCCPSVCCVSLMWWYVILAFPCTDCELLFVKRVASEAESFEKKKKWL